MIMNFRLDNTWKKSQVQFIFTFDRMVQAYNDQQPNSSYHIDPESAKELLTNAVAAVPNLASIIIRQDESLLRNQPPCTYVRSGCSWRLSCGRRKSFRQ